MEQISRIGMDTSKHIFQLHGVNTAEEPVLRKELRRKEMFAFLEKLAPTVIGDRSLRCKPPLCAAAALAWAFGEVDRAAAGQAVRQARQERRGGCGSALRGDESTDDALRAGEDG